MRTRHIWTSMVAATAAALSIACGLGALQRSPGSVNHGPVPPVVSAPPATVPVTFDTVICKIQSVDDHCPLPIVGAAVTVVTQSGQTQTSNVDGYNLWTVTADPVVIQVFAPGYDHYDSGTLHPAELAGHHTFIVLTSPHVDPSSIPLGQLAAIRGAMWPSASRCPGGLILPFGPRPGKPDNIIATDFFAQYSADDQKAIIACLKALGYTNVVMGPLVDSDGYHGTYTPRDWRGAAFEQFLDVAQTFWDAGLAPVVFLHPDGWSVEQTRGTFTAQLSTPRAQKLLRIVVPAGWEPAGYEWSSCTWALYFQWARETLPNALVLWHNAVKDDGSPYDAPVGTDGRCDDNGRPNAEGWARVAPYLHGLLLQFGPFSGVPDLNTQLGRDFAGQFDPGGLGADAHGFAWHFSTPATGWPQGSAWGSSSPVLIYIGEVTAYFGFWKNMPEGQRIAWGDFAMQHGAAGYLDGGSVAVPVRR